MHGQNLNSKEWRKLPYECWGFDQIRSMQFWKCLACPRNMTICQYSEIKIFHNMKTKPETSKWTYRSWIFNFMECDKTGQRYPQKSNIIHVSGNRLKQHFSLKPNMLYLNNKSNTCTTKTKTTLLKLKHQSNLWLINRSWRKIKWKI